MMGKLSIMNKYVKVVGHSNWFLVLEPNVKEPENLSSDMVEIMIRSEISQLHKVDQPDKQDLRHRMIMLGTQELDYEKIVEKYNKSILIRPSGSYMLLVHNEIIAEKYDSHFPIDEYGEVVICENDSKAEYKWVQSLKRRFPNKKIVTINFFDLKSEDVILEYFNHADYITFSTTFSSLEWFEKLTKLAQPRHKIIGWSHDYSKWDSVAIINPNVEIVKTTRSGYPVEAECNNLSCRCDGFMKSELIHLSETEDYSAIIKCPQCNNENIYFVY